MKKLLSLAMATLLLSLCAVTAFAADAVADKSQIDTMTKGDAFRVDNSAPVISAAIFDSLAKLNDYKAVTLSGSGWSISANVYGIKAQNLTVSDAPIKTLVENYEENEFKFLSFTENPQFASRAVISADVSAIAESFGESFYVYRFFGGRLYKLAAQYSAADAMLTFAANNELGSYVITDKALTGSLLAGSASSGSSSSGSSSTSSSSSGSSTSASSSGSSSSAASEPNPDTGSGSMVGMISALALVAAISAAGLSLKK